MRALVVFLVALVVQAVSGDLVELTDESWQSLLEGEWMVKFYAPWCPACRSIAKEWAEFATWDRSLNLDGVAEVDVTHSPGLSGRFLITSLPTIFHVKDGEFRVYSGGRSKNDFMDYVEGKKWEGEEALPSWKNPAALHMSVVSWFFKISMHLRNVHSYLTEQRQLPSWSVYVFFAITTVVTGALLGLMLVVCIDCVLPFLLNRGSRSRESIPPRPAAQKDKDSDAEEETDEEEIRGEEEEEEEAAGGDEKKSPSVRARRSNRPRKDD